MNKQDAIDYINKWIPNGKQNTHAELLVDNIYEFIYSLEQQNTALQARIKELEEPKTCDKCKYFFQRFNEDGHLKYNVCDKGINACYDKFSCMYFEPKDTK